MVNRRDTLHLVSIRKDFKFAAVIVTFEGDAVGERADGPVLVFPVWRSYSQGLQREVSLVCVDAPGCRGDTRNPVIRLDFFFVNYDSAEFSCSLIPLQRVSGDGGDVYLSPKVPRKITKVSSLFDNRAGTTAAGSQGQGKV